MMSGIRGRNTKPEILIRSLLHRRGFRFRLAQDERKLSPAQDEPFDSLFVLETARYRNQPRACLRQKETVD